MVNTQLFQEYMSMGAGGGASLEAGEPLEEVAWVVAGEEASGQWLITHEDGLAGTQVSEDHIDLFSGSRCPVRLFQRLFRLLCGYNRSCCHTQPCTHLAGMWGLY